MLDSCGTTVFWTIHTTPGRKDFEGQRVPEVLLSGDHKLVEHWRRKKALEKTLKNRPDLLQYAALSEEDKQLLG